MRCLELFSGSGTLSKIARSRGHETIEVEKMNGQDIMTWNYKQFKPGYFDMIWASPPCTCFSMAGLSHHIYKKNDTFYPKTEFAFENFMFILKTWEIIMYLQPDYWFIENPKATMKKLPFMSIPKEVWYCQYGEKRAKPTDIWTNANIDFKKCYNNNPFCNHERSPRGSKTGTQGLKCAYDRAKLPEELCLFIIKKVEEFQRE